jgi:hypothetical protein
MACPFFFPVGPGNFPDRPVPARTPLGALFQGECHASPGLAFEPDPGTQYAFCNFGYGRGICPNFPENAPADAVRFTLTPGGTTPLYVLERYCAPVESGEASAAVNPVVRRQAEVWDSVRQH